jgi:glycosyltransferase involved in cell wall biosynthesis
MSTPTVSAIITTYNRANWLSETICAVMNQSLAPDEIIVVDDGSDDDTQDVIKNYASDIKYIYQDNYGISSARNRGLQATRGEYIAYCDSDDLWCKDKLKHQVDHLNTHPDCFINYTDEIWIRNGVRVNPKKRHRKVLGDIYRPSLDLCLISPSSAIIARKLFEDIGGFDEALPTCEDYDLWLRIARSHQVCLVDKKLIKKRGGHDDQLSRKYWGMDRFRVKTLVKLLTAGDLNADQHNWTQSKLYEKCKILAQGCVKRDRIKEGEYFRSLPSSLALEEKYHHETSTGDD